MKKIHTKLGELASTAICGNDISSSVLYVSALAIFYAGQYAWITLLIVALVLYFFRKIYGEVVGALPLNGGAYNALLNTTSKQTASLAASLTLLSYMATAVISANEGMHYLHHIFHGLPVILATIILLAVFALLTIMGISESAKVAIGIFLFHLASLALLSFFILFYLVQHGFAQFMENWHLPMNGSIGAAIFFGFAASMLGISGFESSANFVEEQERGVFPKTLRNMWVVVSVVNPLMAFLALCLIPIDTIKTPEFSNTLLSKMGELSGGSWLATIISIDAVLVLSGAVLTSYVGVTGLLERMSLDRILPQVFLKKNRRGSSYIIILSFFILSVSVLLITKGKVTLLAGVYTISFLSVMFLFGVGNVLLKVRRASLPRPENAPWTFIVLAVAGVLIALVGNILMPASDPDTPESYKVFLQYFIPAFVLIMFMLKRVAILNIVLQIFRYIFSNIKDLFFWITKSLNKSIEEINAQHFVFFTKRDNMALLNKVVLYIKQNEHTKNLKLVHVSDRNLKDEMEFVKSLEEMVRLIDEQYPEIDIELEVVYGIFGPELIQELSKRWKIPINFMFIASPGDKFPYRVEELGGVRLII
ncbi:MAG: APC family permease [Chitinophagales bacterium]|nr:APC family permease [Chitinophagales bacterium]